jgi:ribulose-5-phosphate 4-epimerase/fuculose-1-phosphate aldolase
MVQASEIDQLLDLSTRLGKNTLLTQASSGNTSIKLDDTLWIKASGTWLANAAGDTLVPLALTELRQTLSSASEFTGAGALVNGRYRQASVETAMHAALPHKVVIHVHSVNMIALAVRADGPECMAERLAGMRWSWIPYVPSGLPLAQAIGRVIEMQRDTDVFVLGNHGLVVCGGNCEEAEALLQEVERLVSAPMRMPAGGVGFDESLWGLVDADWKLPDTTDLHLLGTDPVSERILRGGILFPCQAIFLGDSAFRIAEGRGIVVNRRLSVSQLCVLNGLLQVVQRIDKDAPIRYLSDSEARELVTEDAHNYHLWSEANAPEHMAAAFRVQGAESGA